MNQCMGCQAKWPIKRMRSGFRGAYYELHDAPDGGVVACTQERYRDALAAEAAADNAARDEEPAFRGTMDEFAAFIESP